MDISIDIVADSYIINKVIAIKVEVIDPGILVVKVSFKTFKCFGFLEHLHYSIKVKIIAR